MSEKKWIRKTTTIWMPEEMWNRIQEYMKKHGYKSFPELIRDVLRRIVEEGG